MIHDPDLLDQLDALPKEAFDGEVFRGTRQNLDPLASSYSGGRWMQRDGAAVLYTSLAREGSLAEISFHWGQLNPRPTKPVMLHTLRVVAHGGKGMDPRDAGWLCDICARVGYTKCACGGHVRGFGEALFSVVGCESCSQSVSGININARALWNAGVRGDQGYVKN